MITSFSTMRIKSALIFVEQWLQCWPLCSSAQIYVWILSGWKYPSGLVFKSHHPTSTQLSLNSRQKINKNSQQISTSIFEGIAASILGITFMLTCQCSTVHTMQQKSSNNFNTTGRTSSQCQCGSEFFCHNITPFQFSIPAQSHDQYYF